MTAAERLEALVERLERAVAQAERRARLADRRIVTAQEAVELGLLPSLRTAARWREEAGGPPYLEVGTLIRYDVAELERWWAGRQVLPAKARERARRGR
ncbi:MAG: hypothetical protein Kow0092_11610 [Deferrisomatales bacterium]